MTDTPTESKPISIVDDARVQAERLEKANAEMRLNIARLETLQAKDVLSGKASAGQTQEKPKEIDPKDYAAAALKGKLI